MFGIIDDMRLLQQHAEPMDRIFQTSDLAVLFQAEGKSLHDRIHRMVENRLLHAICRGFYGSEGWTLESLSARLYPDSFVSGPSMLAEYLMIGTQPIYHLFCVKAGLPRKFALESGTISFHSIKAKQMFGFSRIGFVNKADRERALVDTLFYYLRGEKFVFDLFSDIHLTEIDAKRFQSYVERFRNPKFKAFAHDFYQSRR
ncbi:MAG TPA: hypothetical protein VLM37_04720 [Fibrobacteraceae bacterium]|nr:hypothetical protein [Fibrobacteraceae bacterium]